MRPFKAIWRWLTGPSLKEMYLESLPAGEDEVRDTAPVKATAEEELILDSPIEPTVLDPFGKFRDKFLNQGD